MCIRDRASIDHAACDQTKLGGVVRRQVDRANTDGGTMVHACGEGVVQLEQLNPQLDGHVMRTMAMLATVLLVSPLRVTVPYPHSFQGSHQPTLAYLPTRPRGPVADDTR